MTELPREEIVEKLNEIISRDDETNRMEDGASKYTYTVSYPVQSNSDAETDEEAQQKDSLMIKIKIMQTEEDPEKRVVQVKRLAGNFLLFTMAHVSELKDCLL